MSESKQKGQPVATLLRSLRFVAYVVGALLGYAATSHPSPPRHVLDVEDFPDTYRPQSFYPGRAVANWSAACVAHDSDFLHRSRTFFAALVARHHS